MSTKPVTYSLEIHQLHAPYTSQASLAHASRLDSHEASTPFGEFHVGDTVSNGQAQSYIGRVQHIHHWVGILGDGFHHRIQLYLFAED